MKKLLVFCFLSLFITAGHGQDSPDLSELSYLPGKVDTYYTKTCEKKARYLQQLLNDATGFFENEFGDSINIRLLVINRRHWKKYASSRYPLSQYSSDGNYILMPKANIYRVRLPGHTRLYGKRHIWFWDFISIHELGHYLSSKNNSRSHTRWMGEFYADYIMIGYMKEVIPAYEFPKKMGKVWKAMPMRAKSLEDFERKKERGAIGYSLYQGKFQELAFQIFKTHGWDFAKSYMEHYNSLNESLDKTKYTREDAYYHSLEYMNEQVPAIFKPWVDTMK